MKRVISLLIALMMLLTLAACGNEKQAEVQADADISYDQPVESTLSPREQFQQQKEAMAELQEKTKGDADVEVEVESEVEVDTEEEAAQSTAPSSFSAGGFTLNLDDSFQADYTQTDGLQTYWHKNGDSFSYTMKIGITPMSNYGGYQTSQEAAEDIAAQKPDQCTVESANGVYYIVQTGSLNVIKAYYVDDSGLYWIIDGMTSSSVKFDDYKDQLIQFCTTGSIN